MGSKNTIKLWRMSQKFLILSKYTIKRRKMNQNKVLSRLLTKENHFNSWIMKFNSKLKVIRFKCKIIGVREIPLIKFFLVIVFIVNFSSFLKVVFEACLLGLWEVINDIILVLICTKSSPGFVRYGFLEVLV